MPKLARVGLAAFAVSVLLPVLHRPAALAKRRPPPVVGRWNLSVTGPDGAAFPSWLEITFDDQTGKLGGRICGRTGRTHPLLRAEWKKNEIAFVDAEGEAAGGKPAAERTYRAKIRYGMLDGAASAPGGPSWTFLGARAPRFPNRGRVPWGKPVNLISKGLLGWRLRSNVKGACWKEGAGIIGNKGSCVDIISDGRYQDFKLHLEYKLEPGARSGVYLRGRYEVQLIDDASKATSDESNGAVFGLLPPGRNAARPASEWQRLDATLIGRRVTVVLNGEKVLDNQEIAGPTGGAIDSEEQVPGPIMLQCEQGQVAFRNIVVTPALW
jgi:hypothetical protein